MSGIDELVDDLVEADRYVIAGLRAFDSIMTRLDSEEIARASGRMAGDGHAQDEIDAFAEARKASTRQARGKLHRELWLRALAAIRLPSDQAALRDQLDAPLGQD
jgi:hypothetical protein